MKLKSVNGKTLGDSAPLVLGAVAGAMVGRGLTAVVAKPAGTTPTQADLDKKMYVQGGMAVAGYVGYAAIDGNDTAAQAAKGACLGIAIDNTVSLIGTLVGKSETIKTKLAADTAINNFAKASLGLGCACTTSSYPVAMNRPRRRGMGNPTFLTENSGNALDQAVRAGSMSYMN
jgi:hypothetical protein